VILVTAVFQTVSFGSNKRSSLGGAETDKKFSIRKLKEGIVMTGLQQPCPLSWKKSTASGSGACVEVAKAGGMVFIRDSKDPSGSVLAFSRKEWGAFLVDACAEYYNT
jgi:hypothetical protein